MWKPFRTIAALSIFALGLGLSGTAKADCINANDTYEGACLSGLTFSADFHSKNIAEEGEPEECLESANITFYLFGEIFELAGFKLEPGNTDNPKSIPNPVRKLMDLYEEVSGNTLDEGWIKLVTNISAPNTLEGVTYTERESCDSASSSYFHDGKWWLASWDCDGKLSLGYFTFTEVDGKIVQMDLTEVHNVPSKNCMGDLVE